MHGAALKGTNLRGQTPTCAFLRKSAVFCKNLHFPNALFFRKRRESARISENLRKSVFGLGLPPWVRPLERTLISRLFLKNTFRLEMTLACRWEGAGLPRSFWNLPALPRVSPNFPRSSSAPSPKHLCLWTLFYIGAEFWEGDATKQKSVKRSAFSLEWGPGIQ